MNQWSFASNLNYPTTFIERVIQTTKNEFIVRYILFEYPCMFTSEKL